MEEYRAAYWQLIESITATFYEDEYPKSLAYLIQKADRDAYASLIQNYGRLSIDLVDDYTFKNHEDDSEMIKIVAIIVKEQQNDWPDNFFPGLLHNARTLMKWEVEDYEARERKTTLSRLREKIQVAS